MDADCKPTSYMNYVIENARGSLRECVNADKVEGSEKKSADLQYRRFKLCADLYSSGDLPMNGWMRWLWLTMSKLWKSLHQNHVKTFSLKLIRNTDWISSYPVKFNLLISFQTHFQVVQLRLITWWPSSYVLSCISYKMHRRICVPRLNCYTKG